MHYKVPIIWWYLYTDTSASFCYYSAIYSAPTIVCYITAACYTTAPATIAIAYYFHMKSIWINNSEVYWSRKKKAIQTLSRKEMSSYLYLYSREKKIWSCSARPELAASWLLLTLESILGLRPVFRDFTIGTDDSDDVLSQASMRRYYLSKEGKPNGPLPIDFGEEKKKKKNYPLPQPCSGASLAAG